MTTLTSQAIGAPRDRYEGREKVAGEAKYTYEHDVEGAVYAVAVQATIARGTISSIDAADAMAVDGVLAVLTHENAGSLADDSDKELHILQAADVAYHGQLVGAVIAESLESAQEAARRLRISYDQHAHDVVLERDHPRLYRPDVVNPQYPARTEDGDPDGALANAYRAVDNVYSTPTLHNNPMEPHATIALWGDDGSLTLYDTTQGSSNARDVMAKLFGLDPDRVRVISTHIGGGFGSKGLPRPQAVLAALAARLIGRPVKLALTRQQLFSLTGYRTPTIQRVALAAEPDGTLTAIVHEVVEQCSTLKEFAEQTAVATRMMYAAPHRRTDHHLAALDVPSPSWLRAPGECPGMFALESALDELAAALELDPVELRARNEPEVDPSSGLPFSSRNLVACLREGASRFGWDERVHRGNGGWSEGHWRVGLGVASSTYPVYRSPATAHVEMTGENAFHVRINATDIGQGARTVVWQIAAEALGVEPEHVTIEIGDSDLPRAGLAGGSMGTASWGTAVWRACEDLRDKGLTIGAVGQADTAAELKQQEKRSRHAYGAQFAQVRVNPGTGEVRCDRLLGVFATGRVINPKTARSQFIGGMTMGLSMALHEETVVDREFGDFLNRDFAGYHVAACADVVDIDAISLPEQDDQLNPMGSKGIGEIGIVGTAAAVASAVFHATGIRIRALPIQPDRFFR